jgi:hypothetical protein
MVDMTGLSLRIKALATGEEVIFGVENQED